MFPLVQTKRFETNRDWGSTMKPITDYAPALEPKEYASTAATTTDAPYNFPHSSTPVYNWDRSYYGSVSVPTQFNNLVTCLGEGPWKSWS